MHCLNEGVEEAAEAVVAVAPLRLQPALPALQEHLQRTVRPRRRR